MKIERRRKPINWSLLIRKAIGALVIGATFGLGAILVIIYAYEPIKNTVKKDENDAVVQIDDGQTEYKKYHEKVPVLDSDMSLREFYKKGDELRNMVVGVNIQSVTNINKLDVYSKTYAGILYEASQNYVYILAPERPIKRLATADITFANGKVVKGVVLKTDSYSNIAIIRVSISEVPDELMKDSDIGTLEFGRSETMSPGSLVGVIGNPYGILGGFSVGRITTNDMIVPCTDGEYKVLRTDIMSQNYTNGFLISNNGKIVGMVTHAYDEYSEEETDNKKECNVITAIAIEDLSKTIERLKNQEGIPYLGMKLRTITPVISRTYERNTKEIPQGIYVEYVQPGSPAEAAGIRAQDIIIKVDEESMMNARKFREMLYNKDDEGNIKTSLNIRVLRYGNSAYHHSDMDIKIMNN